MPKNRSMKSAVALGVMAVVGSFIVPSSANAAPVASSWTQPGYNGAWNQANLTEKTLTVGNVKSVNLRRTYTGVSKSPNECFSADSDSATNSVISGGYLFTSIRDSVARTSLKTGVTSWRRNPLSASDGDEDKNVQLAVSGNTVVVTFEDCQSNSAPSSDVYALNAATGATVWSHRLSSSAEHISVSGSYLVLSGGVDTDGHPVIVYKLATGVIVWQRVLDFSCDPFDSDLTAIVEGGQVITCSTSEEDPLHTVEADSLATGSVTWTLAASDINVIRGDTDAVATGHQLYLSTPNGIIDVNPKNGADKFTMAGATSIDAVSGTTVYGSCGSNLCAFNIAFGSLAWSVPNPTSGTISAWADDVLYMSDGSSINDSNGVVLTHTRIAGLVVVGDGYVVVRGGSSRVVNIYGLPNS